MFVFLPISCLPCSNQTCLVPSRRRGAAVDDAVAPKVDAALLRCDGRRSGEVQEPVLNQPDPDLVKCGRFDPVMLKCVPCHSSCRSVSHNGFLSLSLSKFSDPSPCLFCHRQWKFDRGILEGRTLYDLMERGEPQKLAGISNDTMCVINLKARLCSTNNKERAEAELRWESRRARKKADNVGRPTSLAGRKAAVESRGERQ